jgi:hypothetical protein
MHFQNRSRIFPFLNPIITYSAPNGLRYLLVGGTRQRQFAGTNLKPRKLPENAPTPTSRVHAVLGVFLPAYPLCELDNLI